MARTKDEIAAGIIAQIAASPDLTYTDPADNIVKNITANTSRRAKWKLWVDIIAFCIAIFEQLTDIFLAKNEAIVARSRPSNAAYIQDAMFKFQYDATTPQILQLVDLSPQYPVVDATKRIITACAVKTIVSSRVSVKCAKGSPLTALTTTEQNAAAAYLNVIGVEGVYYDLVSLDPNRLYIAADIYFDGQYASVIKQNVVTSITSYLQQLSVTSFAGSIQMSDLEGVIRRTIGVNDVVMNVVVARAATTAFISGVALILNSAVRYRTYNPEAGYMIPEDTAGLTLLDSLNFVAV